MAKRRQRRASKTRDRSALEVSSLPALSLLTDLPALDELACDERQRAAYEAAVARLAGEGVDAEELELAAVVRLDRGYPALVCGRGVARAEFAAQLTKGDGRAAVGDWVCLRLPEGHDMGLIQEILPRRSDLVRWRGGSRGERQTLAANIDIVLVVAALGEGGPSLARLARSAVVARDCGAEAAIVLTKADRTTPDELAATLEGIRATLAGVRVAVCCSAQAQQEASVEELAQVARTQGALWGEEGVRELVAKGSVGIMLGESGAGKSTLLNTLLGREALETGAVRARDDQGRHTTVTRRMVSLPGAGVIVDAPGLRSLAIMGHERGLALVFPELAEAAQGCRFRDCTHTHEPGCAVRELVNTGAAHQVRADAYIALAREMRESASSLDPDVTI